jgi:gliding motility-associated-like protein
MQKLLITLLISYLIGSFDLYSQTLIINEVSQGPAGGNKEYVEFVVVDNTVTYDCNSLVPPCIDIRGWIFDDNSGYHGTNGVAGGACRFSYNSIWSCVPLGTIIVVYNNGDLNADMPPDDLSMDDGNCRIVAPISNTVLFESNSTTPGAIACDYPSTGWTPGGSWGTVLLANTGDCSRIVDLSGCEVFSVCWAENDQNTLIYFESGGTVSNNVHYFNDGDPYLQSNWSEGNCGSNGLPNNQTPGEPNNAANAAYISQFNNGCQAITPIVAAAVIDNNEICGCDGQATASGSGSIPGYTYEWFDNLGNPIGQTTATATGLCQGSYSVVVTSSIDCSDSETIIIGPGTSIQYSAIITNDNCSSGNGQIDLTATGGDGGPYQYSIDGGLTYSTSGLFTTLQAGTYAISVIDNSGCEVTGSETISTTIPPTILDIIVNASCQNTCEGQAEVVMDGPSTDYSYLWVDGLGNTVSINSVVSGLCPGGLSVVVTDIFGCSVNGTATISGLSVPSTANIFPSLCEDNLGSGQVSGVDLTSYNNIISSEGTQFSWYTNISLSDPVTNVLSTTVSNGQVFYVHVSNGSCSDTSQATFSVTSTITLNSPDIVLCESIAGSGQFNSYDLTSLNSSIYVGGGSETFTWFQSDMTTPVTDPANVSVTSVSNYWVEVTDGNCSNGILIDFTVNPLPTASISGGASYCPGDPITNITVNVTGTGPWTINYTLDGSAQTASGSSSPISLGNTPGVYVLTGVQDALCSNTASGTQTITVNPTPVITLTPTDPATCNGSDGSILVSGTGTGNVIWSGTSSSNANGVSLNYTISNLTAGTYDVYFVDGATGCQSATVSTTLLNANGPTLTVSNPPAVCSPATVDLTASASTDIGTISYYTDPTYTTLVSDPTAVGAGTYYVVADNAGCTDEGTITVVVNPTPVADPSTTTPVLCAGETVVLNATSVTGGTYSWSGPNSFVSTTQDPQITNATTAASGTYTLTVTANGCTSAPATVDVLVNPIPVATAGTTTPSVCVGADIALTGNATSGTYSWSGPNGFSSTDQNPVISPSTLNNSGTYTLTITADGCVSLPSNVSVTVNPLPVIDGGEDVTVCEGTTVVLSGSGGVSYVWTSDVVNGAPFTPALGSIVYTVTGTDANGCVGTDNVTVNVVPVPNADLSADVTYGVPPLTVTFTNSSTDATSYAWNLGNGNTFNTTATGTEEETYGTEGVYTIVLTASNGICSDLATVIVTVESPAPIIHVPNVFSPNGDGSNDVFFIDNMYLSTLNVKIFNRWGNLMHEITDPAGTWDGNTPDGKEASDGVYFFTYVAVGINQTELSGHGNVTLVR